MEVDADWLITCGTSGYNGKTCEYPPGYAAATYPINVKRFDGTINATYIVANTQWVTKPSAAQVTTRQPGVFFFYGIRDWPNKLLFIGGGNDLKTAATLAANSGLGGNDPDKFKADAKLLVYKEVPGANLQEITAYVNILKSVFCAYANSDTDGGVPEPDKCILGAQAVDVLDYVDTVVLKRMDKTASRTVGGTQINLPSIPQRLLDVPQTAANYGNSLPLYQNTHCLP